jgi:hypothetical protein
MFCSLLSRCVSLIQTNVLVLLCLWASSNLFLFVLLRSVRVWLLLLYKQMKLYFVSILAHLQRKLPKYSYSFLAASVSVFSPRNNSKIYELITMKSDIWSLLKFVYRFRFLLKSNSSNGHFARKLNACSFAHFEHNLLNVCGREECFE